MLRSAVVFLITGMVLALVGFTGLAGYFADLAGTLSLTCFVVFALLLGLVILADIAAAKQAVRRDRPSAARDRVARPVGTDHRWFQGRL